MEALRFARKLDAERAADRCCNGIPVRIADHIWTAEAAEANTLVDSACQTG